MPFIRKSTDPRQRQAGEGIHAWSFPAVETCPGRSELCTRVCYARSGRFRTRTMQSRLAENLAARPGRRFRLPHHRRDPPPGRPYPPHPRQRRLLRCRLRPEVDRHRPPVPPYDLLRLHPILAGALHRPGPGGAGQPSQRPVLVLLRRRDRPAARHPTRGPGGLPPDRPPRGAHRRPDLQGPAPAQAPHSPPRLSVLCPSEITVPRPTDVTCTSCRRCYFHQRRLYARS